MDSQNYEVPPRVLDDPSRPGYWWARRASSGTWSIVHYDDDGVNDYLTAVSAPNVKVSMGEFDAWVGPLEPPTVKDGHAFGGGIARTR